MTKAPIVAISLQFWMAVFASGATAAPNAVLKLGMPRAQITQQFASTLRRDAESVFLSRYRDHGVYYADVGLKFSGAAHRLTDIKLAAQGERACHRLQAAMDRAYGKSKDRDLMAEGSWTLWKLKGEAGYVSFSTLNQGLGLTCTKQYSLEGR